MARTHARILTSIWSDDDFRALPSSAQRVYILAVSQPNLSYCGVVPYTARRWAKLATDTTARTISSAVATLIAARFLLLDEDTEEVLVRTFSKNDGLLKQPNLVVTMSRDFIAIQSPRLREAFLQGLPEGLLQGLPEGYGERLDEGFVEAFEEAMRHGSLTRVRARRRADPSPSPSPSPSPVRGSAAVELVDAERGAGSAGEEDEDDQEKPGPGRDGGGRPGKRRRAATSGVPVSAVSAGELGELEAVWAKLAEVDLERFLADGGVVRWRASWLRTAAANRARDHGDDVEAWRAEGVDWPDIVARLTAQTQADPGEDRGRVIPSAAETRARIDAADAEAAETARLDALVDALPEVERVSLEAAACEWATANWAGGEAPPAMVRSKMRALVAANGTARGTP